MTSLTEVFVTVKPDMDKFGPEVKKKLSAIDSKKEGAKVAGRFGVGFNGAFGGIVKHSAGLFVGAFAAIKGAQFLGNFINDARESAKVARVSAQVIKSTGGVAGITAAQIGDLATAISNKTGADDEAIQSGENLLATFTNVRNETGKGNDIFNRATQAAVDMASAMNNGVVDANGLKSANIQLGKALNDPVKGVTALTKVGVSFTAKQKEQIKTLVDSGKTLEAQKIILGEVGKEFGGAAAAASDPLTRLKTIVGNASESIGGAFLPIVDKLATKLGGFIPDAVGKATIGFEALKAAFEGEGVTSSGFVGFMERVGVVSRQVFDTFKASVLPRLKEFGGFLTGTVVPAVRSFASFLVANVVPAIGNLAGAVKPLAQDVAGAVVGGFQKLFPILQQVGQFIADTIVPAVVDFTKWLKDNSTVVGAVAVGIGAMVLAFKAYQLALTVGAAATKAYAVVQGVLNAVMSANPIGIVVLALIGLAAGLTYAWKKSETFRKIVTGVWNAIRDAAKAVFGAVVGFVKGAIDWIKANWPLLLAILTGPIGLAVYAIAKHWTAIKQAARDALAFIVDRVLAFGETILKGASKAFGWVPGLGDKLKGAATEFGKFRDEVNAKLKGINDQTVNVTPHLKNVTYTVGGITRTTPINVIGSAGRGMAEGGGVFGGTRGKDSVPALLMPDEHVWTTKEVAAVGGHGAMERIRKAALHGELNGFATGGGVKVRGRFPSPRGQRVWANDVAVSAVQAAKPLALKAATQVAQQLMATAGDAGPPGSRKSFRGVTLNERTIRMLLNAERILGAMFHITQGSYSTRVRASGSTHAGGGAMDTNGPRGWDAAVAALRKAGFAAWHRTPSQGPWNHHIHSIAIGDPTASPAAKAQVASFKRGGNGLGGMAAGGRVGSYATGAWRILADQLAVVHKGEMVVPRRTADGVRGIINSKLHRLHQAHVAHQAHLEHVNHVNTTRLHPDDMRHLGRVVADELRTNPPRVHLDGRLVDDAMTRRALNGGH